MPRQPRLDAPGVLHHVMVRGIERTPLLRDDPDRADFVARLGALADARALTVYAWALLPNHAHLLVRTGHRPLPRSMRSLLTGYAGAFNRHHTRVGHLFQNRYKSLVVEKVAGTPRGHWRPSSGSPPQAVYQAVARGRVDRARWGRLLKADA